MTKAEFLLDPNRYFYLEGVDVPLSWVAEAWDSVPAFRDNVTYELTRSVRKNGDFFIASGTLRMLAELLSLEQAVALYEAIRDQSGRMEPEWRPEFEEAFPGTAALLPPVRQEESRYYWGEVLFQAIMGSNIEQVERVLAELHRAAIPLRSLGRLAPESLTMGGPLWWGEGNNPEEGLTFLQVAERASSPDVQQLLRAAG